MLLTAFALGPFLWMLLTSLKDRQELYATPLQYLPVHPTFENYIDAWTSPVTPFSRFFLNSLWVCSVTMVATTVVSVLAGYAIARFRFAGRDALLLIFLATQMFPSVLLIAPLLTQWRALGLIDTYQALIYSNFSFTVPFTVWMMVGYFSSIPRDLEESAMIDGCNHFGALCRIVLPLAAPGIAATAIFAFVVSWSELLFAISFTTETNMRTLSAGPALHGRAVRGAMGAAVGRRHPEHGAGGGAVQLPAAPSDPRADRGRGQGLGQPKLTRSNLGWPTRKGIAGAVPAIGTLRQFVRVRHCALPVGPGWRSCPRNSVASNDTPGACSAVPAHDAVMPLIFPARFTSTSSRPKTVGGPAACLWVVSTAVMRSSSTS